jgi:branched-chain amino acid transport system permease protein
VLGAAILTVLSEAINAALGAVGIDVPGVKQVLYGVVLGIAIMFMPNGVWPGLARRLGFGRRRVDPEAEARVDRRA